MKICIFKRHVVFGQYLAMEERHKMVVCLIYHGQKNVFSHSEFHITGDKQRPVSMCPCLLAPYHQAMVDDIRADVASSRALLQQIRIKLASGADTPAGSSSGGLRV